MSEQTTTTAAHAGELHRGPGEEFWLEGDADVKPLVIRQGVVAYRRGSVAIGLMGPGEVVLPIPGTPKLGPAAADLVAVTEATVGEYEGDLESNKYQACLDSARAVVEGADRLGNMSLPQRLAALLLDITDMTGQPVVGCRQDILAMAAAARRETVATILSGWRDEDWIQTRYRRCKVMDRDALIKIRDRRPE
ncbi:MAG: Crp/Fnr family transcriptional regulator [Armatimonadota bacterium]